MTDHNTKNSTVITQLNGPFISLGELAESVCKLASARHAARMEYETARALADGKAQALQVADIAYTDALDAFTDACNKVALVP